MYTKAELMKKFEDYLLNIGIKGQSIPSYTTPLSEIIRIYLDKKKKKVLSDDELFDLVADAVENMDEYVEMSTKNLRSYRNLNKVLEYFTQFANFLQELKVESPARYKIFMKDYELIHAEEIKPHETGLLYVKTTEGEEMLISPGFIRQVFIQKG
ncbi:hypothetical protein [Persephonella sp.]